MEGANGNGLQFGGDDESSPLSSSPASISFSETTTSFETCAVPSSPSVGRWSPSSSPTSSSPTTTVTLTTFSLLASSSCPSTPSSSSPPRRRCPPPRTLSAAATAAAGDEGSPDDEERRKHRQHYGDALTQKRSLITAAKPRTRSQDRLSGEFAVDKGRTGRLRGASFGADSRGLTRDDSPQAPPSPLSLSSSGDVALIRHEEVYMEGWLNRIGADRRWFVLTANTFAYFRDENMMRVETRTRIHREDIKRVTRSVVAGTEQTVRRTSNALMRMVRTPSRTRKKGSAFSDAFGSPVSSPARNTKSQQSPTTGSEKNLGSFPPNFYILTSCAQERVMALMGEDCVETALWMLALGGLAQRNLSVPADSPLDEQEQRELLRYVHLEGYKGGILKMSREEEWHYWPKGLVKSDRGVDPPLTYSWDGESFTPVLRGEEEESYGWGRWNGVWMEWHAPGTSSSVPAVLTYQWHPVAREYRTERADDNWKWTRHFLASTSGQGEWIMEGEIPEVVVMMLQMLVYARDRPEMLAEAQRQEQRREEAIIQSRLRDFESTTTDFEVERLLQLRKMSLENRRRFMSRSDGEAAPPLNNPAQHEL